MGNLVGIDTSLALTSRVGSTGLTVWQYAKAWLGRVPDFIVRPTGRGGGAAATPLSAAEIAAVAAEAPGLRFGGYFNDSALNVTGAPPATAALGQAEAQRARAQLRALGFPDSCPVLIDLELSGNVTLPYLQGVRQAEASAIVYGDAATIALAGRAGVGQWLSRWGAQQDYANAAALALPAGTSLWQFAGDAFNGVCDEDDAPAGVVAALWTGVPPQAPDAAVRQLLQRALALLGTG